MGRECGKCARSRVWWSRLCWRMRCRLLARY